MIDPDQEKVDVEPVGGVSRGVLAAVVLIALVLAVAILKPWDSAAVQPPSVPPPRATTSVVAAQAAPVPVTTPDTGLAAAQQRTKCGSEPEWRLLTMETGPLGDSRTLYGELPAQAFGPTDPGIASVELTTNRLYGIGVCRPRALDLLDAGIPVGGVTIWHISSLGPPSPVSDLVVLDRELARVGEAYFGPPDTEPDRLIAANTSPVWAPGRYVVEIDDATPQGDALWFGLDFASQQTVAAGA